MVEYIDVLANIAVVFFYFLVSSFLSTQAYTCKILVFIKITRQNDESKRESSIFLVAYDMKQRIIA